MFQKTQEETGFLIDSGRKNDIMTPVYIKLGLKVKDKLGRDHSFSSKTLLGANTSIDVNVRMPLLFSAI